VPALRLEHVAFNVADPVAAAAWYVEHLGMRVARKVSAPPHMHFLADASGSMLIELYSNPVAPVPDYAARHPIELHIAFATDDPDGASAALVAAGATPVDDTRLPDGSRLLMLRDPWGLALQLCQRATPILP
jgi:catechol 2,3-dioxygenase-like lactoylglutathione lyase family enzyme